MGIILFVTPPFKYNIIEDLVFTPKFKRGAKFWFVLEV